jgi:ATP-dependent Zn protease
MPNQGNNSAIPPADNPMASSRENHGGPANPSGDTSSDASDEARIATAYHEAGHAVMAISLGRNIQIATILPAQMTVNSRRLGAVKLQKGRSKSSRDPLEDEVLILFAGMVAESHVTGKYCQQGAASDLRAVGRLLQTRVNTEKQFEKLQRRLLEKTEHLLSDNIHRPAVEAVAKSLLEKQSISGRLVRHYLNQAQDQSKK